MAAPRYNQLCVVGFECFVFHFILFLFNNLIFKYQTSFAALFRVFLLLLSSPLVALVILSRYNFICMEVCFFFLSLSIRVRLPVICLVPVCFIRGWHIPVWLLPLGWLNRRKTVLLFTWKEQRKSTMATTKILYI